MSAHHHPSVALAIAEEGCLAAVSARPRTPLSGRPPGGLDGKARTERVVVYLSAGELAAVQALAEHAGKPPAVLAREAILGLAWARRGMDRIIEGR